MASEGLGLGKEVLHGLAGGVVLIVICVTIGSMIAQVMSHGPEATAGAHGEAAPASLDSPQDVRALDVEPAEVNEQLD